MKTIYMGVNTDPAWVNADEVIKRLEESGNEDDIQYWKKQKAYSLELRDQIYEALKHSEAVKLSWECEGRTRHAMHAHHWEDALPDLKFSIDYNYYCVVRKR